MCLCKLINAVPHKRRAICLTPCRPSKWPHSCARINASSSSSVTFRSSPVYTTTFPPTNITTSQIIAHQVHCHRICMANTWPDCNHAVDFYIMKGLLWENSIHVNLYGLNGPQGKSLNACARPFSNHLFPSPFSCFTSFTTFTA